MTDDCTTNAGGAHILVVDDEADIGLALGQALTAAGYDVTVAASKQQALRAGRLRRPDLVIADLCLSDGSGLEVVDRLRATSGDLPAVIITGRGGLPELSEASRRRPVEVLNKPIDLFRLRQVVWTELQRQQTDRHARRRTARLREVSRKVGRQRKQAYQALCRTCADLTASYRSLKTQLERERAVADYQTALFSCANEDDIFRRFFRLFVERTGPLFGVAMLCDENAQLQLAGRFGVPAPDGVSFSLALAQAVTPLLLERPEVQGFDAVERIDLFPASLHRLLVGVNLLLVPLMAGEGEMIGMVVLYRKGEQPFTQDDLSLSGLISAPTAAAIQK